MGGRVSGSAYMRVPPFESTTGKVELGQGSRSRWWKNCRGAACQVTSTPEADATLRGKILNIGARQWPRRGPRQPLRSGVTVQVTLVNKDQETLYTSQDFVFRET